MLQTLKDPGFESFLEPGLDLVVGFLKQSHDIQRIQEKFKNFLQAREEFFQKDQGVFTLLTSNMDEFGEFMSEPFVEVLKNIVAEVITEKRNSDPYIIDHKRYWE